MLRDSLSRTEVRALRKVLIDMGRLVLAIGRPDAQARRLIPVNYFTGEFIDDFKRVIAESGDK
jgi:hypothetical protein